MNKYPRCFNRLTRITAVIVAVAFTLAATTWAASCLAPVRNAEEGEPARIGSRTAHQVSYYLDQVGYSRDSEIKQYLEVGYLNALFGTPWFVIQNNRLIDREIECSGGCFYCYARRGPLAQRRKTMVPSELPDAAAVVNRAIDVGFRTIQVNGQDTLQDLESFFSIVHACKDKKVHFLFFTNGFYFLEDPQNAPKLFKRLKERLGNAEQVGLAISWDPAKVAILEKWPQFHSDSSQKNQKAVLAAMAKIIHDFKTVFPRQMHEDGEVYKYPLVIKVTDVVTDENLAQAFEDFSQELRRILQEAYDYNEEDFADIHFRLEPIDWSTPEAFSEGVRRGRAKLDGNSSIDDLIERMWLEQIHGDQSLLNRYWPFFDMSTGELATCIRRSEYPRRAVTPESFDDILLKPFSNPLSRRLFSPEVKKTDMFESHTALVRQLEFACVFDPSLRKAIKLPFEVLESHIFCNEELMTKIELAFLLEDILFMAKDENSFHEVTRLPRELIEPLFHKDISLALLTSYKRFKEYDPPVILSSIIRDFQLDPDRAIANLQALLRNEVIPQLKDCGVISPEPAHEPPPGFLKTAVRKADEPLPHIEDFCP